MHHFITLLIGGVLGHCPVEKQMIVPLNQTRWDGVSLQNAVEAMLVKRALNCALLMFLGPSKSLIIIGVL
jgi:hypothetical protein